MHSNGASKRNNEGQGAQEEHLAELHWQETFKSMNE